MIKVQIVTNGSDKSPWLEDEREFDAAFVATTEQARETGKPQLIELRPVKGYGLSLVVGDAETFIVYGGKGRRPMYCHSRGPTDSQAPYHLSFQGPHELSTPRRLIIPMGQGLRAVKEFIANGQRPACITWEEMVP